MSVDRVAPARPGAPSAGSSKTSIAYETLRARILDGTYGPGYRLVVNRLGLELGMSPIPLREAIRRLEAEGWVDTTRFVGAQVAAADVQHWIESMQALALLEAAAMRLLAGNVSERDLKPARDLNRQMRAAVRRASVIDAHRLNREFHLYLYSLVPNEPLVSFLRQTWDALGRMRRDLSFYLIRAQRSIDEHDELLDLLASGATPNKVEAFSRRHKERTLDVFFAENPGVTGNR